MRDGPFELPTASATPRLLDFRDVHRGAKLVVCGCGVSLASFSRPDRFLTIGVNDVGRAFQPDYLVVLDGEQHLGTDRFAYVASSGARTIFTPRAALLVDRSNVVRFRFDHPATAPTPATLARDPLPLSAEQMMSPISALCLALYMGATTIGLIGVDLTDHHFFARTGPHSWAPHARSVEAKLAELGEAFRARGARVFNLSGPSELRGFPKMSMTDFAALRTAHGPPPRRIVCYAATPRVGVPALLARCINRHTRAYARAVWPTGTYDTGLSFTGDIDWQVTPEEAHRALQSADAVVLHGGRFAPAHETILDAKPVVTLAHAEPAGMDLRWVRRGLPALVLGQHQATMPAYHGWLAVPSPLPLHEAAYRPERKNQAVTIVYAPPAPHGVYPPEHPLYWHGKGHAETIRILDRLARRHPVQLATVRGRGISHEASLAMKRRAHIVIDECVTGSFHRSSLEGLATGCVVVNAVVPHGPIMAQLRRHAEDQAAVPFIYATLETLESVLEILVALGPDLLTTLGAQNRAWTCKHWSFARQWRRFWLPAITAASNGTDDLPG